ncbi:MAG: hypothetical protein J6Y94_08955, partial [Bacteriovoracaceae bacterium]|nr:hypothetical protein [Bacteriovoracaceae bacterium]
RENTATLTTGIVGALEDQKIAALTHLAHTHHQEAFYLEEAYTHPLSLRLLLQQLETAVANITADQNEWPLEAFTLRGQINRRFQRCFAYITAAWRLNTYVYHAFGQYRDGLAKLNWANDVDQNLPFISEDNLFYFPVTHTFKWTINEQGRLDLAYPATFTYYYVLPAAVLADAQVKPNQSLDHLLVLNAQNLAQIQVFIHQQNAYLQDLATQVRYLWQHWSAIYKFPPHPFAIAIPSLAAKAQKLPWPRPWPPGRKAYQQHEVLSLAKIDFFTADFFLKAPPLEPELVD